VDVFDDKPLTDDQIENFKLIEFIAYYSGIVTPEDMQSGIGRLYRYSHQHISAYVQRYPGNLVSAADQEGFVPTDDFTPHFADLTPQTVLSALSNLQFLEWESTAANIPGWLKAGGLTIPLRYPDKPILAAIIRAIRAKGEIEIDYLSLGQTQAYESRVIKPHALGFNGQRWHVRAYDAKRSRFSDFVLSRIVRARPLSEAIIDVAALDDRDWWERVTIELIPHPGLTDIKKLGVIQDYAFEEEGTLKVKVRKSFAAYLLLYLNVDYTADYSMDPRRHHLALRHPAAVAPLITWLL
jgi:hypothetical protein